MTDQCPQGVFRERDYWEKQLTIAQKAVEIALKELERIEEKDEHRQNTC